MNSIKQESKQQMKKLTWVMRQTGRSWILTVYKGSKQQVTSARNEKKLAGEPKT